MVFFVFFPAALPWLAVVFQHRFKKQCRYAVITLSLQVLLIKEALCKKHFSPVLISQINKNKTFCQAVCFYSYPSTGLK